MAKISFSYFVQDKLDPKTKQVIGRILRPYIPIRLSLHHGNPTNYVNALVDSGSDRNLFPRNTKLMLTLVHNNKHLCWEDQDSLIYLKRLSLKKIKAFCI